MTKVSISHDRPALNSTDLTIWYAEGVPEESGIGKEKLNDPLAENNWSELFVPDSLSEETTDQISN